MKISPSVSIKIISLSFFKVSVVYNSRFTIIFPHYLKIRFSCLLPSDVVNTVQLHWALVLSSPTQFPTRASSLQSCPINCPNSKLTVQSSSCQCHLWNFPEFVEKSHIVVGFLLYLYHRSLNFIWFPYVSVISYGFQNFLTM